MKVLCEYHMHMNDKFFKDKNFALGTWEMHLWTSEEKDFIFKKMFNICKYVDTAIDYNNDYLLDDIPSNISLISKISSYHASKYDWFVENHLKCLKRDNIDVMLIHSNRGNWQDLVVKMQNDKRFKEVGVSNFTVKDIEEYKLIAGKYPAYNEIEINPYYTDLNTIKFCKDNRIKIIAYGVFGGKYNSPTYVADFSVPYLLEYAFNYVDIVILKPESFRHVKELEDIVMNYELSEKRSYVPVKIIPDTSNKSIEPMRYFAKDIKRYCMGVETYVNWCGKNTSDVQYNEEVVYDSTLDSNTNKIDVPSFEMLGDYLVYLRYLLKNSYSNKDDVYKYDILVGDDAKYVVYLYDEKGRISKINKCGKVKVVKINEKA